jgi:hypothetical protein
MGAEAEEGLGRPFRQMKLASTFLLHISLPSSNQGSPHPNFPLHSGLVSVLAGLPETQTPVLRSPIELPLCVPHHLSGSFLDLFWITTRDSSDNFW